MSAILKGMRVVEGSAFVAVPLAGMTLAQMGADVIRFDRLQGGLDAHRWPVTREGSSLFWAGLNKGKRSIAVDMKSPRGREIITQIITAPGKDAGLFLTNLRVRGWMDYASLSRHRHDLVMVSLLGDRMGKPQVDYTVNPAVGFPNATGPEGSSEPVAHVLPAWDCIAGNMVVTALLAAERQRLRTGKGDSAEITLKDVAAAMLGNLGIIAEATLNGIDRGKAGNALYGAYGQDFVLKDGHRIMVIGLTDRQWRGLLDATGTAETMHDLARELDLDLNDEGNRWLARKEITARLVPWFAARNLNDCAQLFDKAGVTWSVFRSFAQALAEDPDFSTDNPLFTDLDQPGIGSYLTPGSPFGFANHPRTAPDPAPALGQHTHEVLADVAGMSEREIGQLFDQKIVG